MKVLIVYDDQNHGIDTVVRTMVSTLKKYKMISVKATTIDTFKLSDIEESDILLFGSPTSSWSVTKKMQALLEKIKNLHISGKAACAFSVKPKNIFSGSASSKIQHYLRAMHFKIISKPLDVFTNFNNVDTSELRKVEDYIKYIWMY